MKIIVYGANETAYAIATEFFEDHDVVVIDPDQKKLENFSRLDVGVMCAEATSIKILKDAEIE